jgi:hypothetical protein
MSSQEFVYWLQGYMELTEAGSMIPSGLSPQQVQCIKEHIKLVLKKETSYEVTPPFITWMNPVASC